ncbi:MAG: PorT family protein [Cyclobacteriaceae bacterium]|nr:PorT family protein [Cyclobacteriaceae bacterium]
MLSKLFVALLLSTSCFTAFCQKTELIFFGGLSSSIMKENGSRKSFVRQYGGHLGVLGGVGSENVLFETGILFSARGTAFEESSYIGFTSIEILRLNFLDIPAMLVIAPSNFRLFFGPQLSILTGGKYEEEKVSAADLSQVFNKTTWGFRYGGGIAANGFTVQLHFILGLSDLTKDPNTNWKNNAYQIGVGYRIHSTKTTSAPQKVKRNSQEDIIPKHRVLD